VIVVYLTVRGAPAEHAVPLGPEVD
jgi:hypothetical protein